MKTMNFSRNQGIVSSPRRARKGFSIIEVAIAMGVVTLLMTTFLGVFGPAQKNILRTLSTKDANRMKDTLSNEMSVLRPTEYASTSSSSSGKYKSSFDKAYSMIEGSHDKSSAVLMYQYKADPTADGDNDGILDAYDDSGSGGGIQGKDYIVQTAVRTLGIDDALIQEELAAEAVEGSVFVIRMSQLVKDTTSSTSDKLVLTASSSSTIVDPDSGSSVSGPDDYPKAVIAFRAEFFRLKSNNFQYIDSANWDFNTIGNAITEANMAVRR